ncbi:MAG: porin family protein, partial [Bacteroidota bacterium]
NLLNGCIENGFNDEEKTEAYRLLTLAYLYLDEPESADDTMLGLLNHNHEFQINEQVDPEEFITLHQSFRTWPIYLYGFKFGGTYSIANVQRLFGVNSSGTELTNYSAKINFSAGLALEKSLKNQRFGGMAELSFTNNQYEVVKEFANDPIIDNLGNQTITDPFSRVTSLETKSWLSLNLGLYYRPLLKNRIDPRIFIGPSIDYLLSDDAQIETTFPRGGEQATGPNEELRDFRNPINFGIMSGINVRSKVGKQFLFFEAKYIHGLVNITEFNFDQTRLATFYGYALDDVNLSHFSVSIGLLFQKYSPKKLTK